MLNYKLQQQTNTGTIHVKDVPPFPSKEFNTIMAAHYEYRLKNANSIVERNCIISNLNGYAENKLTFKENPIINTLNK